MSPGSASSAPPPALGPKPAAMAPPELAPPVNGTTVDEDVEGLTIDQCCSCGEPVYREYCSTCKELARDPATGIVSPCDHAVCEQCMDPVRGCAKEGCQCDHIAVPPLGVVPPPPGLGNELTSAITKLVDIQGAVSQTLTAMQQGGSRGTFKIVTMLHF